METLIPTKPRLAFCGVGWIGRNRMQAAAEARLADIVGFADTAPDCLAEAQKIIPYGKTYDDFDDVVNDPSIDAVIIATPSAFHMEQSVKALEKGKSVFCQKPLGRNSGEVRQLLKAAKQADRLLGADFSYRYTKAFKNICQVIRSGELGKIFAVDLKFHNAYGPDKAWFYDLQLAGGGCMLDLGIHLVDLMLLALDFPEIKKLNSTLLSQGQFCKGKNLVEDYATVQMELENDVSASLSCSWNLKAGCDAVIEASFFGTNGGVSMKNMNGSFYDFRALRFRGTNTEVLADPPDNWGGKALVNWIRKLSVNPAYDPLAEQFYSSAKIVDLVYGNKTT